MRFVVSRTSDLSDWIDRHEAAARLGMAPSELALLQALFGLPSRPLPGPPRRTGIRLVHVESIARWQDEARERAA